MIKKYASVFLLLLIGLGLQAQKPILWTVRWSPDNKFIAVGGNDNKLRLIDAQSFEVKEELNVGESVMRLSWHPTEHTLLAVGASSKASFLLDVSTMEKTKLDGPSEGVRGIAWNPNGTLLAGGAGEGKFYLWEKDGTLVQTISKENTVSFVALDWHPEGEELVTFSDEVRIYSLEGEQLDKFRHREEFILLLCIEWHPSGDYYMLGDYGNPDLNHPPVLQLRNTDGEVRLEIKGPFKREIRNVRWSPDGRLFATASDALRIYGAKGQPLWTGKSPDPLWGIDWSPDGKYLVTSSETGRIRLWDAQLNLLKELKF